MKPLTTKQQAEKYAKLLEKRREYYKAHAEERKAYQRARYREMRAALLKARGSK